MTTIVVFFTDSDSDNGFEEYARDLGYSSTRVVNTTRDGWWNEMKVDDHDVFLVKDHPSFDHIVRYLQREYPRNKIYRYSPRPMPEREDPLIPDIWPIVLENLTDDMPRLIQVLVDAPEATKHVSRALRTQELLNEAVKVAAEGGHLSIVKLLIKEGADPGEALMIAIRDDHVDLVKFIIENKEHQFSIDSLSRVLGVAAWRGSELIVRWLLENNVYESSVEAAAVYAKVKGHEDIVSFLEEKISDYGLRRLRRIKQGNLFAALDKAFEHDHWDLFHLIVLEENICDAEAIYPGKLPYQFIREMIRELGTFVSLALESNRDDIARLIFEKCDPKYLELALQRAAEYGYFDLVEFGIRKGIPIRRQVDDVARRAGREYIVRLIRQIEQDRYERRFGIP